MWITVARAGGYRAYLYDIEGKKIVGELINGSPVTMVNATEALCMKVGVPRPQPHLTRMKMLIELATRGIVKFKPPASIERYWIVNLEKNQVGKIGNIPHTGTSDLILSPGYQYAYKPVQNPTNQTAQVTYYLFNLKNRSIHNLNITDVPCEWWDDTHILMQSTNHDFSLYDVRKKVTQPLAEFSKVKALLGDKIDEKFTKIGAFCVWNGRENNIFLTDMREKWMGAESFLISVNRSNKALKLVTPAFEFESYDHFDPTGRFYVYTDRETGAPSDTVYLRELGGSNVDHVLVPRRGDNPFSVPHFYRDTVIYFRNNAIWQIQLNGSNNTRLFPQVANEF